MHLRKRIILVVAAISILGISLFAAHYWMKEPDPTEPVALVNGVEITFKALQREVKKARNRFAMKNEFPDKAELKQIKKDMLERLIERELLWQHAVRNDMVVSNEAVSAEFEVMKKQYGNEAILNNMLKNWEMPKQEFIGVVKRDLTIAALIEREIAEGIFISDAACENYYRKNPKNFEVPERIRASHICIFLNRDAADTEKQKAEAAMQSLAHRLRQGERFEDLARKESQCASGEKGGDLGFFARGTRWPLFEEAAFALKLNELSDIVRSDVGYHIIKVTDREPARCLPFEEVRETIAQQLRDEKINNNLKDYLSNLLKQADIQRFLKGV